MKIVDANIILRYLLNDHNQLSAKAADIIENNDVFLTYEVLCEVVYVLQKVYDVKRDEIRSAVIDLINNGLIIVENNEFIIHAMDIYCTKNIDIVDAILCSYHFIEFIDVCTFDKKLEKCLN